MNLVVKNQPDGRRLTWPMILFDFAVCWYYFMGGSLVLRPMAGAFWLAAAVVGLLINKLSVIKIDRYEMLCLFSVLMLILSSMVSINNSASFKYSLSIATYFLVAYEMTRSYKNVCFLFKLMTVFVLFLLAATLLQKYLPGTYEKYLMPLLPDEYRMQVRILVNHNSYTGFFNQTSSNSSFMCMGVCLGVFHFMRGYKISKARSFFGLLLILTALYCVVLTNRRGSALIIVALVMLFVYWHWTDLLSRFLLLLAVVLAFAFSVWNQMEITASIVDKTSKLLMEGDITNGRIEIWRQSLPLIWNRPVFGHGIDTYNNLIGYSSAHNSYIQSFVELGVLGSIVFFAPYIYGLVKSIRALGVSRIMSRPSQSIIVFGLMWQLYSFGNALVESNFSSESSIFMLMLVQMSSLKAIKEEAFR